MQFIKSCSGRKGHSIGSGLPGWPLTGQRWQVWTLFFLTIGAEIFENSPPSCWPILKPIKVYLVKSKIWPFLKQEFYIFQPQAPGSNPQCICAASDLCSHNFIGSSNMTRQNLSQRGRNEPIPIPQKYFLRGGEETTGCLVCLCVCVYLCVCVCVVCVWGGGEGRSWSFGGPASPLWLFPPFPACHIIFAFVPPTGFALCPPHAQWAGWWTKWW